MRDDLLFQIGIPAGVLLFLAAAFFLFADARNARIRQRIARVTHRPNVVAKRKANAGSLRKMQESSLPFISDALRTVASMSALQRRLERAGLRVSADVYVSLCVGIALVCGGALYLLRDSAGPGVLAGLLAGGVIPYMAVGVMGGRRNKKFIQLFPDAIDFIVRGLRSGLPVMESFNVIGEEMEEPLKGVFSSIGEQVRLGVPVEKTLQDVSRKLNIAEFNFFVTSIILQRETGGNLSEILNNLADVLRKRFMMRMKIKAMAAEAKASAMIVGALPFMVFLALLILAPDYLDPLFSDDRGHVAALCAGVSMALGIGIMFKMSSFEI